MELELRFRLSEQEFRRFERQFDWSVEKRVFDLTLGPSGATSMQTHGWVLEAELSAAGRCADAWDTLALIADDWGADPIGVQLSIRDIVARRPTVHAVTRCSAKIQRILLGRQAAARVEVYQLARRGRVD